MASQPLPTTQQSPRATAKRQGNVTQTGRVVSALLGGAALYRGLEGRDSLLMTLLGGYLVYRGATGHCPISASLAPQGPRDNWGVSRDQGIGVEEAVIINKSAEVLYNFWRNFENLPRFMDHLQAVTTQGERSHWVAKAPLGQTVEWDAEVVGDLDNELISWRSLPGSTIPNAGSVRFTPVMEGKATQVKVSLKYAPPAGALGAVFAKLFGEEPSQQIRDDLNRFKALMEGDLSAAGSVATTQATTGASSADQLGTLTGEDAQDRVLEASEESFPASDPPAFSGPRSSTRED